MLDDPLPPDAALLDAANASPATRFEQVLGWLPGAIGLLFLPLSQSIVDVVLCLLVLARGPMALRLPNPRRRRQVLQALMIIVGTLGVAALLGGWMARLLHATLPWFGIARFGLYLALWVLALRQLHQILIWLMHRTTRRELLARSAAAVVLVVVCVPHLFVALQTHRIAIGDEPIAYFAVETARSVQFESGGLQLRGTLVEQDPGRLDPDEIPIAIICHGLGANRANLFAYAQMAHIYGCHVLAFDFRAHGCSDGVTTTLGGLERDDVVAAARWLRTKPQFAKCPLVLLGVSMGAASVLRAAKEVGASGVFAESSYADLDAMVADRMGALGPLCTPMVWSIALAAKLQLGIDLDKVSPRQSLAALPDSVSVVLVHAGDDRLIPVSQGRELAAARAGQELHLVPGASHGACLYYGEDQLEKLLYGLLCDVRGLPR